MDPDQTWRDLSSAVAEDDWDRVTELAEALLNWLGRGGFPPTISGCKPFDELVARAACEALRTWEVA